MRFVEEVRWTSGQDIVGERLIVSWTCRNEEPLQERKNPVTNLSVRRGVVYRVQQLNYLTIS